MINYLLRITIGLLILFASACDSRNQAKKQTADSLQVLKEVGNSGSTTITPRLVELGLTADSDWRGVNLGDDFVKVKTIEKAELFENDANHVGYTIEFKNLETADILYYHKNQRISVIDVDLFLNNQESVEAYKKELTDYFTARYGTPKIAVTETVWTGMGGKNVKLKDVSKGKDFGLKVQISSGGNVVTASAK